MKTTTTTVIPANIMGASLSAWTTTRPSAQPMTAPASRSPERCRDAARAGRITVREDYTAQFGCGKLKTKGRQPSPWRVLHRLRFTGTLIAGCDAPPDGPTDSAPRQGQR
jgi:hypothetical protein